MRTLKKLLSKAGALISGVFLRGIAVILPITLTVAVLVWLATTAENFLGGLLRDLLPEWDYWPGLGIVLGVALIFAAGIIVNARVTQTILDYADSLLARIPIVKSIYLSIRDVSALVSQDPQQGFRQVVAVRVQDMRLIGFVTTEDAKGLPAGAAAEKLIGVYLPMSYGIGGYTVYLPKALVEPLDMSLEDAMRVTLSGGVSASTKGKKLPRKK